MEKLLKLKLEHELPNGNSHEYNEGYDKDGKLLGNKANECKGK